MNVTRWTRAAADERGQSLVEVALALPIMLLIVIGIIDIGRVYAFKTTVTNSAREAAIYAARDPQATFDEVCQRARDELGIGAGGCTTADVTVTCKRALLWDCGNEDPSTSLYPTWGQAGADVTVTVTYRVSLLSGYLIGRAFPDGPLPVTVPVAASAWFPGLTE